MTKNLIKIGCEDGRFGDDCHKCNCRNESEVCHKKTGECTSGCRASFQGVNCLGMNNVYIYVHRVMERHMYIQRYSISFSTVMQNIIKKKPTDCPYEMK